MKNILGLIQPCCVLWESAFAKFCFINQQAVAALHDVVNAAPE